MPIVLIWKWCRVSKKKNVSIVIGGDLVPIGDNLSLFRKSDGESLIGAELMQIIHSADFSFFNLETPLVDSLSPISKCGPALAAPTESILGLKAINPGAFSLANNHIMDQGLNGLASTCKILNDYSCPWFGAGDNVDDACRPYILRKNGLTVGFYSCCEHEFSVASSDRAGANPFDPYESFDHVSHLSQECDHVVVLYHGGKEHYRYPSPELQKTCRKFVEVGADIVICQHSHCVGCFEDYAEGVIVYGQGNFLFDHSEKEPWQTGLLVEVVFGLDSRAVKYHPLQKEGKCVALAKGSAKDSILSSFCYRSKEITQPGFIEESYKAFAKEMVDGYLSSFLPGGRSLAYRALNKLCGHRIARMLVTQERLLANINFLECEAHRELFIQGLHSLQKEKTL